MDWAKTTNKNHLSFVVGAAYIRDFMVYSQNHAYGFLQLCFCGYIMSSQGINVINLLIFFRVTQLALGQSSDCTDKETLKDMGKTGQHLTTIIHRKAPFVWDVLFDTLSLFLKSLAPGIFEWYFRYVIFKQILVIEGWGISWEIAQIWMSLDFIVNIGSGNGLVPSGNKPLPDPMLTPFLVALWRR